MIYLDNMATTPVASSVAEKMVAYLTQSGDYGNASAVHYPLGQRAADAIANARVQVATCLGAATPESIVFTSGATEAINLALQGVALAYQHKGKHIISKACEHSAVLDCLSALQKQGFAVTYLRPDENGLLSADAFRAAIRPDTIMATFMWVNNEIGVIQDIQQLGEICHQHNILFHVDAAQAVGKCEVNLTHLPVDLLSLSAHKFYGPKGVGALYIRPASRCRLQPILFGGGQQGGLRPGTLATHQIVGLGAAATLAQLGLMQDNIHIAKCQEYARQRIAAIPGAIINGDQHQRVPHNINFSLPNIQSEALARQLGEQHICVATGSACHAAEGQPSHVLRAIGRSVEVAQSALRLSFSCQTTLVDLATAFDCIESLITVK